MPTSISSFKYIFSGSGNRILLGVLVGCFVAYSFLIGHTVIAINQRKAVATQIQAAQATLSTTEIAYFNAASTIDMTKAMTLGFVDSKTPDFAYTNPTSDNAVAIR